MKPYQAFLFILFVFGILGTVYLSFYGYPATYAGIAEISPKQQTGTFTEVKTSAEIPAVTSKNDTIQTGEDKHNIAPQAEAVKPETQVHARQGQLVSIFGPTGILFPEDSAKTWALLNEKLSKNILYNKPLRILYYGDSQIENDRITSVFRKKLQERYGGAGRGLVPVRDNYNSANNIIISASKNWETSSVSRKSPDYQDFGLLCETFTLKATSEADSALSWIKVRTIDESISEGYSVASIYYRSAGKSTISVEVDGGENYCGKLESSGQVCELRLNFKEMPSDLEIKFSTSEKLSLFGFTLESPQGIMVDNIALRGRSNPSVSKIDPAVFKQMAGLINPAFVILQYGVNVVPYISDNYGFYRSLIENDIRYLKENMPGVPILLVGVSDMAHKVEGSLVSYPNLKPLVKTQKEIALDNGCAFWNLYETMGGAGSMIDWANRQPPLGNKDYIHYTPLGAEKVGNMLAQEFIRVLETEQQTVMLSDEF